MLMLSILSYAAPVHAISANLESRWGRRAAPVVILFQNGQVGDIQ